MNGILWLTIGVTVLSFCVATFFAIALANVVEYLLAKHDVKRFKDEDLVINLEPDGHCHCSHCHCHHHCHGVNGCSGHCCDEEDED